MNSLVNIMAIFGMGDFLVGKIPELRYFSKRFLD